MPIFHDQVLRLMERLHKPGWHRASDLLELAPQDAIDVLYYAGYLRIERMPDGLVYQLIK